MPVKEQEKFMGQSVDTLIDDLQYIFNSSGVFAVISTLSIIKEPLHLSRIAVLIGMGKSTVSGYIESLVSKNILQVDIEKTINTRGNRKYYTISTYGDILLKYQEKMMKEGTEEFENQEEVLKSLDRYDDKQELYSLAKKEASFLITKYGADSLRNFFLLQGEMNRNIEKISVNQYIDMAEKTVSGKEIDDLPIGFGTLFNRSIIIKVLNLKHIMKIKEEANRFLNSLQEIGKEIEKDIESILQKGTFEKEDIGTQYVYLSLSPLPKE